MPFQALPTLSVGLAPGFWHVDELTCQLLSATEATFCFIVAVLLFLYLSLYGLIFSWLRLCLLTSIAVCAVFCNPSSFSRSPRVWLQPVLLSGISIILTASVLMADWIESYKLLGIEGLKFKRKKKKGLSYEDKCKIVREYQESELTLFQLSAKYQLSSSLIGNWVKLVERNGFEALESRRSRYFQTGEHMVKRLPKEEYEKENERLRKENERLRLENLLLKKVRALVEEREARNRAIGNGPSKN